MSKLDNSLQHFLECFFLDSKPYGILYHKYPLSRLPKLSAVNTSVAYSCLHSPIAPLRMTGCDTYSDPQRHEFPKQGMSDLEQLTMM